MIIRVLMAAQRIEHLPEVLTCAFLAILFILAITILASLVILGAMGTHARHSGEQEEYLAEALRQHQKRWAHMRRVRKAEMKFRAAQQQKYKLLHLGTSTFHFLNRSCQSVVLNFGVRQFLNTRFKPKPHDKTPWVERLKWPSRTQSIVKTSIRPSHKPRSPQSSTKLNTSKSWWRQGRPEALFRLVSYGGEPNLPVINTSVEPRDTAMIGPEENPVQEPASLDDDQNESPSPSSSTSTVRDGSPRASEGNQRSHEK
ncbi:hypothetical protein PV10_05971 [Exophiala mesophila]|uniref:Uncharacterized protein n=1 Tax=Exophiala mesophila TaxID=212818 RepID=A0A0D1WQQ9_EXOME|nr:uncharacterized protein PV10_05971 [Exophiala mesophila]KIV91430.1 hypothetical protein PV10_05971 [Exophiala mesophila]